MDENLSFAARFIENVPHYLLGSPIETIASVKKSMTYTDNLINYQRISAKLRGSGTPAVAGLELTCRCNIRCRHCYVTGSAEEELTLSEYRGLIDDLYDLGTFCLVFTGGEPLLRDDFFDIVGHARKKGFLTVLFTNGTRIDRETADRIEAARFWQVEISLCGATADTHDLITRCPGSFKKTVAAVRHLRRRGITVNLKTLLTRLNVHEFRSMETLARSLGAWFRFDVRSIRGWTATWSPLIWHCH